MPNVGEHVRVLLLVDESGILRIRVDPKIRRKVPKTDWPRVHELLRDFATRAKMDPAALFTQLSSLNWGPLVTVSVGVEIYSDLLLASQIQNFVPLDRYLKPWHTFASRAEI